MKPGHKKKNERFLIKTGRFVLLFLLAQKMELVKFMFCVRFFFSCHILSCSLRGPATQPLHSEGRRPEFLWPGIHGLLLEFWVVSRKWWQKNWNFGGFMEGKNKINWNHLVPRLGPRASVSAAWAPAGFKFFFAFHEYHQSFNFFCHHFREYHPKLKQ